MVTLLSIPTRHEVGHPLVLRVIWAACSVMLFCTSLSYCVFLPTEFPHPTLQTHHSVVRENPRREAVPKTVKPQCLSHNRALVKSVALLIQRLSSTVGELLDLVCILYIFSCRQTIHTMGEEDVCVTWPWSQCTRFSNRAEKTSP